MRKYVFTLKNDEGDEKYYDLIVEDVYNSAAEKHNYIKEKISEFLTENSGYKCVNIRKIKCYGCIHDILNQDGHTSYNGCLYSED